MAGAARLIEHFASSLDRGRVETAPYRHWLLEDVFPDETGDAIAGLEFPVPPIADTKGRRETHNHLRQFFSVENRARFPVCAEVAEAFQAEATVRRIERACGIALAGSYLRIEYCQDTDGFWLEPHTDIGAKLFSMLIYLSRGEEMASLGTDIFDETGAWVGSAPAGFNRAMMFVPAENTWHGFRRRPIPGVRKSLIVNYVKDEWRSRHELAYPEEPVG